MNDTCKRERAPSARTSFRVFKMGHSRSLAKDMERGRFYVSSLSALPGPEKGKRTMKKLAFVLLFAASVSSGFAETEVVDGITWTYLATNGEVSISGGSWSSPAIPKTTTGEIAIPTILGGCPVTSIGKYAFSDCSGLSSITIPNSVTNIGSSAFSGCSGLTSITIPDGVKSIGSGAFFSCFGLTSITIGAGISSLNGIPDSVHEYHVSEASKSFLAVDGVLFSKDGRTLIRFPNKREGGYSIPNTVTNIGSRAFSGCSGLTSITIPDGVASIGNSAFHNCSGLTSITIPDGVTSIGSYAFGGCSGLTSITIPASVTSIGNSQFGDCSELAVITVSANNPVYDSRGNCNAIIRTSDNVLIAGCNNTVIPSDVTSIGDHAFYNCHGLTLVSIPNSVTNIEYAAFSGCDGISSITIPDSVTHIGDAAFVDCSGLQTITIPGNVTSVGNFAFHNCSELASVTIQNGVKTIGNEAFSDCPNLTSITIPDSMTSIGENVFRLCSDKLFDMSSISGVKLVDGWVVGYTSELELSGNLDLTGTRGIGDSAFYGSSYLTSVLIPSSVINVGNSAFYRCSGLESVSIQEGVDRIGHNAFESCHGLTSITIPNSVASIGNSAFRACSGLTSVTIPDDVTIIEDGLFEICSALESIIIPEGVTSVGDSAFCGCSLLASITIPNSVTNIGSSAFQGCSGLKSIVIPNGVTSIGHSQFFHCSELADIWLPRRFEKNYTMLNLSVPSECTVHFYDHRLVVTTEHGVSSLDEQTYWDDGTNVVVVVAEPEPTNGMRSVCTGWTGTGSVPANGTETNVTFTILENSTLTWNWEEQVLVECTVESDGAPAVARSEWTIRNGEDISMAFTKPAVVFVWTLGGDTNGVVVDWDEGRITVPTDAPRSVRLALHEITVDEAVRTGDPVNWSTGGTWFVCEDETASGGYSLRSGRIGAGETSSFEATVEGSGTLSFDWRISSARGHYAKFCVDGVETNSLTRSTEWATFSFELGSGTHTMRWTYEKGTGATAGEDAAFLDNVRWEPLALAEALDATSLVWTTGGDAAWVAQTEVSADGEDAARSGAVSGEETSWISTVVTNAGTLSWKWKADVAGAAGVDVWLDGDSLYDDGIYLEGVSGWTDASLEIEGDGEHVVTFEYWNGETAATISDCAYIDQVSWTPAKPALVVVEGVGIPVAWLDENASAAVAAAGGDYEAAVRATAANGADKVWQCYVSGVSPTNAAERFEARIGFENGGPVVSWTPDLGDARAYVVLGKTNLVDASWGPTNESTRFFRVKVSMP